LAALGDANHRGAPGEWLDVSKHLATDPVAGFTAGQGPQALDDHLGRAAPR
jgi:hypothetical protein